MNTTKKIFYLQLSVLVGVLLAIMAHLNFKLASATNTYFSSLWVHLIGFLFAILLLKVQGLKFPFQNLKVAPKWAYLSGVIGALSVVTVNLAISGPIGLSGTLALSLSGQIIFGRVVDAFGLFGMQRRAFTSIDFIQIFLILSGAFIIIFKAKGV